MMGSCLNCWAFGFHIPLNSCTMRGLTFCTSLKEMRETKNHLIEIPQLLNQDTTTAHHSAWVLGSCTGQQLIRLLLFLFKRMLIILLRSLCDNTIIESLQISGHTT